MYVKLVKIMCKEQPQPVQFHKTLSTPHSPAGKWGEIKTSTAYSQEFWAVKKKDVGTYQSTRKLIKKSDKIIFL